MSTNHPSNTLESSPLLNHPNTITPPEDDPSLLSLLRQNLFGVSVAGWIAQIGLLIFVGLVWFVNIRNPAGIFNYHPYFQSLAILGFTEGVLLLQPTNTSSTKKQGLKLHQIFQLISLLSVATGSSFIIYNKALHSAQHFTTYHAKFGLLTLTLILIQIIFGATMIYFPSLFGGSERSKGVWKYHRISGYIILILLYLTAFLATTYSDWFTQRSSTTQRSLIGVGLVGVLGGLVGRMKWGKLGWGGGGGEEDVGRVRLE